MIKIGAINIDVSHPKTFSEKLKKDNRAKYVAVYNDGFRKDDEVEGFIKKNNLDKRFYSIDELADYVDVGFIHSCNWDNHLKQAMPFILRKKPVFIDKPIVGSLADCIEIEKYAKEGAIILGSSSVRYANEVVDIINESEKTRGKIVSISGSAGLDEFNYGIHTVEPIHAIAQSNAISCRYLGVSEVENGKCETFFVKFKNGVIATYSTYFDAWQPHTLSVITTKTSYSFILDTPKVYDALLTRICDYMETGKSDLARVSEITQSIRIMLAGKLSRENNGKEILLSDMKVDDPGFDGTLFEKNYAKNASEIYLD